MSPDDARRAIAQKKACVVGDVVAWPKAISKIRHKHVVTLCALNGQEFSVDLKDVREAADETFESE